MSSMQFVKSYLLRAHPGYVNTRRSDSLDKHHHTQPFREQSEKHESCDTLQTEAGLTWEQPSKASAAQMWT